MVESIEIVVVDLFLNKCEIKQISLGDFFIDSVIKKVVDKYGVDEKLICVVIKQELGFNVKVVSGVGVMGFMQFMLLMVSLFGVFNLLDLQ